MQDYFKKSIKFYTALSAALLREKISRWNDDVYILKYLTGMTEVPSIKYCAFDKL